MTTSMVPPIAPAGTSVSGLHLSPRELQVLNHLASGLTGQQISRRLGISTSTVETYLNRVRTKLDAPTRAHLIRAAIQLGL
jgi:DNA-binding CsgD family transcriptional regulator